MAGLSREIAKNFGSVAEFSKMNRIQQEAAAKAVGMSREELATTLTDQAALKGLSGDRLKDAQTALDLARAQGMTEDQIAKQGVNGLMKQQSVQDRLNNSVEKLKEIFVSIAEPILQIISPIVNILLPALSSINYIFQGISGVITGNLEGLSTTQKVIGTIVASLSAAYIVFKSIVAIQKMWNGLTLAYNIMKAFGNKKEEEGILLSLRKFAIDKGRAITNAIAGAWESYGPIPFVGAALAAAAAIAGVAYINSQAKSAGDMYSPANGKTQVSTKEGGLFNLSPNDSLFAFPESKMKTNSRGNPPQQSQLIDHDKMAASIARAMSNQPVHVTSTVDGNVLTKAVGKRSDLLGTTLKTNVYQTS
jgi:hypothetical protein